MDHTTARWSKTGSDSMDLQLQDEPKPESALPGTVPEPVVFPSTDYPRPPRQNQPLEICG